MTLRRYAFLVLGVTLATLGLAWPLALGRLDMPARRAVLFGSGLAVAKTLAAHALVVWSSARPSTNAFLGAVLGGMVGRMALMLAAVVAGVLALGLPKLPLALSLLCYFVVFLIMELSILHRRPGAPAAVAR